MSKPLRISATATPRAEPDLDLYVAALLAMAAKQLEADAGEPKPAPTRVRRPRGGRQ